ncbi:MAG: hypothetical protein U0165_13700 [Polyangiaceae bacterium]
MLIVTMRLIKSDEGGPSSAGGEAAGTFGAEGAVAEGSVARAAGGASAGATSAESTFGGIGVCPEGAGGGTWSSGIFRVIRVRRREPLSDTTDSLAGGAGVASNAAGEAMGTGGGASPEPSVAAGTTSVASVDGFAAKSLLMRTPRGAIAS